jgi:hypothetical protein
MSPEDQVRELLEDAVADVEPRHPIETLRARTAARRHRSRATGVAGSVIATAATVAAVVALVHGLASTAGGPPTVTQDVPAAGSGPGVLVYFAGATPSGPRLFAERHPTPSRTLALAAALSEAVAGSAADVDYRSPWPQGTSVQGARLSDGVLSVDLSGAVADRPAGVTRADATLALQQLVYTAQAATGERLPVTFLLNGRPTATLLGEPTSRPVPAASEDTTLASVSVTSPGDGATVTSPFRVQGRAAAFEATVQWELERGNTVVRRGFATATQCCTLAPYSFRVQASPGSYLLVVHDENPSGGEGLPPTRDTKQITVR